MKSMSVAELKAGFSEVLELVKKGDKIEVTYGRAKKPVAMLVPPEKPLRKRQLGFLENELCFEFEGDMKMTTEELLGL